MLTRVVHTLACLLAAILAGVLYGLAIHALDAAESNLASLMACHEATHNNNN